MYKYIEENKQRLENLELLNLKDFKELDFGLASAMREPWQVESFLDKHYRLDYGKFPVLMSTVLLSDYKLFKKLVKKCDSVLSLNLGYEYDRRRYGRPVTIKNGEDEVPFCWIQSDILARIVNILDKANIHINFYYFVDELYNYKYISLLSMSNCVDFRLVVDNPNVKGLDLSMFSIEKKECINVCKNYI